ncbi:MAG: aminopeptidase [Corallococcus sp.]|nr:aminopeptidase [Corallococcus sp.]
MITLEKQKQFAELAVRVGANMQKGQEVVIRCDVKCADFAHLIEQKAYEFGAKKVHFEYLDEDGSRLDMLYASTEAMCNVPEYKTAFYDYCIKNKCCMISISARDPNIYAGIDSDKLSAVDKANNLARSEFRKATMSNYLRWTIVSIPTESWAKVVFPDLEPAAAVDKMWDAMAKIMRLDASDPTAAWKQHIAKLHSRAKFLNDRNFEYLHYTSSNGTDLTVGLAKDHVWLAAEEEGQDGVPFTANMPTEEIFTAPHKDKVFGVVKNALPLVNNGNVIDGFSITFKDGKVTDFTAEKGYDALKGLLSTDEGVLHLGEAALIGKNSPIAQSGILFYNTLFDENASCHLAFGKAYPTTVKNGNAMSAKQLAEHGVNDSLQHVDFMIGSKDIRIEGIGYDGTKTLLFDDGEWVI